MSLAAPKTARRFIGGETSVGYTAGDPLAERWITDREVFWATLNHAAELAGVDPSHVATSLRLSAVPGEPLAARRIHDVAAGLARAGHRRAVAAAPRGPSPEELAAEVPYAAARHARPGKVPAPRRPRGRPRKPGASQQVPAFGARARALGI